MSKFFGGFGGGGDGGIGGPPPPGDPTGAVDFTNTGELGGGIFDFGDGVYGFTDYTSRLGTQGATYVIRIVDDVMRIFESNDGAETPYTGDSDDFSDWFDTIVDVEGQEGGDLGYGSPGSFGGAGSSALSSPFTGRNTTTIPGVPPTGLNEIWKATASTIDAMVTPTETLIQEGRRDLGKILGRIPILGPGRVRLSEYLREKTPELRAWTEKGRREKIPAWLAEKLEGPIDDVFEMIHLERIPVPIPVEAFVPSPMQIPPVFWTIITAYYIFVFLWDPDIPEPPPLIVPKPGITWRELTEREEDERFTPYTQDSSRDWWSTTPQQGQVTKPGPQTEHPIRPQPFFIPFPQPSEEENETPDFEIDYSVGCVFIRRNPGWFKICRKRGITRVSLAISSRNLQWEYR